MAVKAWTLFGQNGGGAVSTNPGAGTLAMQFTLSQNGFLTGIWFNSPSGAVGLPTQCAVFLVSTQGVVISNTNPTWSGTAGSGWVKCFFDGVFQLHANTPYKVAIFSTALNNIYGVTNSYFTTGTGQNGLANGIIAAPNNTNASPGQGSFFSGGTNITYPGTSDGAGENFWVDVEVTTGVAAPQPPVAGFGLSSPRSWSTSDLVTTPRLRADMFNNAALANQGRPFFFGANLFTIPVSVGAMSSMTSEANSWNVLLTQGLTLGLTGNSGTTNLYPIPLPGWWLIEGSGPQRPVSGGRFDSLYTNGVVYWQGTANVASRTDFSQIIGPSAGTMAVSISGTSGELLPFTPASSDAIGYYGFNTVTSGCTTQLNMWAEWVGLPGSASVNGVPYTGPIGTVVANPKPSSLWPAGPGVTLSGSVSAGGTVLTLPVTPGLRAGGIIGLDWQDSMQSQPYAETATIASVAGGTITTTSPLLYGHAAGAPVAVPVSTPFLNEQIRDAVSFQFYPPMLRAIQGTASVQSITNNTWTTLNLSLTGAGIVNTIDNFTGWATVTANSYTIPVSGVYLIIGQVYFVGSTAVTNWGARLIDNNGVTYQGELFRQPALGGAETVAAAVRRVLRLTAGQTIAVQAFQNSGTGVNTNPSFIGGAFQVASFPRLIVVFRAF